MVGFRIPLAAFRIPKRGFRIPQTKITWIPDSGLPYMGRPIWPYFQFNQNYEEIREANEASIERWTILKRRYECWKIGPAVYSTNNIQATISAVWSAENMSINPKVVNSAISPVQKSEIEWKIVILKMTDSSDKI